MSNEPSGDAHRQYLIEGIVDVSGEEPMTILSGEARLICATLADAASTVIAMSLVAPGAAPARYSLAVDKDRISPRERYLLTARVTAVSEGQGAQARRFETTKAYPWSPAGEGPHRISVEPVE